MSSFPRRTKLFLGALLFGALLSSCATPTAYYQNLNGLVQSGQFTQAADLAEKSRDKVYGNKSALLYHLDRGLLLHQAGDYAESNRVFEQAKRLADEYFTKSVTSEASTLLVSDNMRPYYGEDFERALIHLFCALNYVLLGQESEALVEARQLDFFLSMLHTRYGHKGVYKEDPFVRYLMGMIFENQGQVNDAHISYWKALESYETTRGVFGVAVPGMLVSDVLRTGRRLGFTDDVRQVESKWGNKIEPGPAAGQGEIVVLHYNGLSPVKIDSFFEISFGKAWLHVDQVSPRGEEEQQVEQARAIARSILSEEQIRMAFPKYVLSPYRVYRSEARAEEPSGGVLAKNPAALVENVGAIALRSLDDRIARVRVRTIARSAIKFALARQIGQSVEQKSNNEVLGWLAKKALTAASTATELADKRSWRSLPDKITMTRLYAREGTCRVLIDFYSQSGELLETRTFDAVTVRPGKKTFLVVRTAS